MIKKIWSIFSKSEQEKFVCLILLTLVGVLLELLGLGLIIPVISLLTGDNKLTTGLGTLDNYIAAYNGDQQLLGLVLILLIVYCVKNLFMAAIVYYQASYSYGVRARVSQDLFSAYLRQPYDFYFTESSANVIQIITEETTQFASAVLLPVLYIITESLIIAVILILLIFASSSEVLVTIGFVFVGTSLLYLWLRKRLNAWGEARVLLESQRISTIQQALGGLDLVKVFGKEIFFESRFRAYNHEAAKLARNNTFTSHLPKFWLEVLAVASIVFLVLSMLGAGNERSDIISLLGLYAVALFRLMPSATKVVRSIQTLRYSSASILHIHAALTKRQSVSFHNVKKKKLLCPATEWNRMVLNNVSYQYPGNTYPALSNINLEVLRGSSLGIIGPSGSGKSSLISILTGLLSPYSGSINCFTKDGQAKNFDLSLLIGYVPQNAPLLDASIRENVAFGIPAEEIDDCLVQNSLRKSGLSEFLSKKNITLDSPVGERGIRLSGGQQQRIGIARALYHEPAILIFDEATSSLDNVTENLVLQTITDLTKEKTIIMVAHRLSTLKGCNVIYEMENGCIVRSGSYREIVGLGKVFE